MSGARGGTEGSAGPGPAVWVARDALVHSGRQRLRIHYLESRPGPEADLPSVVLLHGLLSSSLQWRGVLDRLGSRLRLLAPDLPGFGRSSLPRRTQTLTDFGDTVDAWCSAVGLGPFAVVGHSFGGMVAIEWLSRPSARPRALALGLAASAGVPHVWSRAPVGPLRIPVLRHVLGPLWVALLTSRFVERAVFGAVVADPDAIDRRSIRDFRWGIRRSREVFRNPDFYELPDLGDRLRRLGMPVRLAWGGADRVLPPLDADVFRSHLPEAPFVLWPGCGHAPMVERPADFDAFVLAVAEAAAAQARDHPADPRDPAAGPGAEGGGWPPSTPPTSR